jgi:phosphoglycolate phosphatase
VARATIILFDIDGTLIRSGGGGRIAMQLAFAEVCHRADALDAVDFRGMTDGVIFRLGLAAIGRASDARVQERLAVSYLRHLEAAIAEAPGFRVLPGVGELLENAGADTNIGLGLGTGNLERGARIKLARPGLNHHFAFGGFGSDHDDRAQVLRIGARRGAKRLGLTPDQCRVMVVGDTPRDVAAARDIGAECIAVETGGHSRLELREAGATHVFADLSDPCAVDALLG